MVGWRELRLRAHLDRCCSLSYWFSADTSNGLWPNRHGNEIYFRGRRMVQGRSEQVHPSPSWRQALDPRSRRYLPSPARRRHTDRTADVLGNSARMVSRMDVANVRAASGWGCCLCNQEPTLTPTLSRWLERGSNQQPRGESSVPLTKRSWKTIRDGPR